MSITPEEAAEIRAEHQTLKEEVSKVVSALHENTVTTREMLMEMRERDVRDEYRQKEFEDLKNAVNTVNEKIDNYIENKQPILDWASGNKDFWDGVKSGFQSNTGKFIFVILVFGVAMALGIDFSNIKVN